MPTKCSRRPVQSTVLNGKSPDALADEDLEVPVANRHAPRLLTRTIELRRVVAALAALAVAAAGAAGGTAASASDSHPVAHASRSYGCPDPYASVPRDPDNPLMLSPAPPAGDPLRGAQFFVDGPRHGLAAGAIAHLLGIDESTPVGHALPSFSDSESWAGFSEYVQRRLPTVSAHVAFEIRMLEKIASEPEPQRISASSQGGSPHGVYSQTVKLFCHNFTADPGTIPIINTYFLHGTLHGCATTAEINRYRPKFEAQIDAIAQGTGSRPVVFLLELDYLGSSKCIANHGALPGWESLMRYEASTLGSLPHAVVYIEAGYSDSNSPRYTARALNRSDLSRVAGFYTNDTHLQWTSHEIDWGDKVSRLTHGAHFVINTAQNGRGPKLNPHPTTQGVEDLCTPPGRGLGPQPNTDTGFPGVDAFLWVVVPGKTSGCGGGPPAGTFWPARAIGMAERAQAKLGPHYATDRY
jgi:hypothetical protein